jgi:hypothetical protein
MAIHHLRSEHREEDPKYHHELETIVCHSHGRQLLLEYVSSETDASHPLVGIEKDDSRVVFHLAIAVPTVAPLGKPVREGEDDAEVPPGLKGTVVITIDVPALMSEPPGVGRTERRSYVFE